MGRRHIVLLSAVLLSGCSGLPQWADLLRPAAQAKPGVYSFEWRLSGDPAVAPLQAFDDGRQTWLQFSPGQPIPAIFRRDAAGDRPLSYTRQGPYVLLDGVWPHLVLRGGHLVGHVRRGQAGDAAQGPAGESDSAPAPSSPLGASSALSVAEGPAAMPAAPETQALGLPPPEAAAGVSPLPVPQAAETIALSAPDSPLADGATEAALDAPYDVGPQDQNLRLALSRWAQSAGWTFQPEHWAVDADIPIVGTARFGGGFKVAVQDLVGSTELSDRPLQPCFYSNRVLRVVPYAQSCDRTVAATRTP